MHELTILSPHCDDAVFSLGLSLLTWRELPLRLQIVNFFTVSAYAPRAASSALSTIASLRQREDRRVIASIDRRIDIVSLGLLDAPLRLGITADCVCDPQITADQRMLPPEALTLRIRKYFHEGLVLAPLGLGDHVDHLAVRKAAMIASLGHKLGFYEDLPYAVWMGGTRILERVIASGEAAGVRLKYCVRRTDRAVRRKYALAIGYGSQIDRAMALTIARFSINYGGGERIWIPKHSCAWRTLTR